MADPEILAEEQAYFDCALESRELHREAIQSLPTSSAVRGHAEGLRLYAKRVDDELGPSDSEVAFGSFDTEEDERWYLGKNTIWGKDPNDILVINWKRDQITEPYYRASVTDALGVVWKREFTSDRTKIVDLHDTVFAQLARDLEKLTAPPHISDTLLDALSRTRTGEMSDIVATIQAAQYEVIRAELDQLLIVHGGPGTGKTQVGLHRLSWLLYNHDDRLRSDRVAVIGPSRPFIRYAQHVLPALGDTRVPHMELRNLLAQSLTFGQSESRATTRLKGDRRMRGLVERALRFRIGIPDDGLELRSSTGGTVRWSAEDLSNEVARRRGSAYNTGRQALRDFLRNDAQRRGVNPSGDEIDRILERAWPSLTASQFVQELYGSESRLLRAAGDAFLGSEISLLYRRATDRVTDETWSAADAAILDYAQELIDPARVMRYDYLVIDEAQDLSPMELDMIARRCPSGSMTVLGDLAQSTGAWARSTWADVIDSLRGTCTANLVELKFGYRVPRQVLDFATQLLPVGETIAPAPIAVREGPEPHLVTCSPSSFGQEAVHAARDLASNGYLVGVICPSSHRDGVTRHLRDSGVNYADAREGSLGPTITLLSPGLAKGLEFDGVIVVDPSAVIAEDEEGIRLLYVALTRTTNRLTVLHGGDPLPVGEARYDGTPSEQGPAGEAPTSDPVGARGDSGDDPVETLVQAVAASLHEQVANLIQPGLRLDVARQLLELLADSESSSQEPE